MSTLINQGHNSRAAGRDFIENINIYNNNSTDSFWIQKYKYLECFTQKGYTSLREKGDKIGYFILDFYFYFLTNLSKEHNLNRSLKKYTLNSQNIDIEQQEIIKDELYFIEEWDNSFYLMLDSVIETEFRSFIDSNDDELLYHAIGFLLYSEIKNISYLNEMYFLIKENQELRNIEIIKYIIKNHKKLEQLSKYKEILSFLREIDIAVYLKEKERKFCIGLDLKEIIEFILDTEKLKKTMIMIDYLKNIERDDFSLLLGTKSIMHENIKKIDKVEINIIEKLFKYEDYSDIIIKDEDDISYIEEILNQELY